MPPAKTEEVLEILRRFSLGIAGLHFYPAASDFLKKEIVKIIDMSTEKQEANGLR